MGLGIGSLTANAAAALSPLAQFEHDLLRTYTQASTGTRINSAADGPSALAISQTLTAQAAGFDQGAQNSANAGLALNVAEGALQSTTDALQSLRSLAVQASNDLLSPRDRANLQGVADQLVRQINTDAQNANYNGAPLLTGQYAQTPASSATASIIQNAALAGGGTLIGSASASASSQSGTIGATVVNGGTGIDVTFTSSTTGTVTDLGVQSAGATVTVNGTSVTLGSPAAGDNGATSTIQVNAAVSGTNAPQAQVQTGGSEGAVTGLSLPNGTSAALLSGTIDLSSTANATNAIGQLDSALGAVTGARAGLGAQSVSLQDQTQSANLASNALTASASNIADASATQTSTELYKLIVQRQISLATLQNANTQFGYLNRFFNTSA